MTFIIRINDMRQDYFTNFVLPNANKIQINR